MLHKMNLQIEPFEKIKNGSKDIEMRVYDEKRRMINVGDIIEFSNQDHTEILSVKVKDIHLFKNFDELYSKFDKVRIGYEPYDEANPMDMSKYYNIDEINKNGVVAIEIELIK